MRTQFLGYYKESDKTVAELWKTATFVFDANVLLNLYRYSDSTRSDFLSLLQTIEDRSWLPEQAAHEFLKNRATVINDQVSSYKTTLKGIDDLCNSFSGSRGHPFITKATKTQFDSAIQMINAEMVKNKSDQEELIHKDDIKDKVADLFDGRVGACYASDKLAEVFKEGADRYDAKVPPGYKDGKKIPDPKTEADKRSNFGDWIIWKQVMDHATSAKTPIIFVTDDGKEDWWEKVSGKTLGPRPELIKEFAETTNQKILIYTPDSFLNVSKTQLSSTISEKSIDEVEAEHLMREKQRAYERMERMERMELEGRRRAAVKHHEELNAELFSKRHIKRIYNRNLEEFQQDDFRRLNKKRFEGNGDTGSLEMQTELSSKLDAAISHKKELMHHAELLGADHHHFGNAEDEEMIDMQRLQHHSIQEELNAISNHIDNLKAQLAYIRRDDG